MTSGRKTLAFYAEALLLTLFLLASLTVLVQMFGAARAAGAQARQQTAAALIAQNVSAEFMAGADPLDHAGSVQLVYNADGTRTPEGTYPVTVTLAEEDTAAGQMLQAHIEIFALESPEPVLALDTGRYCRAQ